MKKLISTLAMIALCGALPAAAQEKKPMTPQSFANKAGMVHQYEIEAAQLALEKSENDDVREFAEKMVEAHQELKNDLLELEKEEVLQAKVSTDLNDKHKKMLSDLRNKSGEEFDQAYIKDQINAHEKALKMFENAEENLEQEELQEYAENSADAVEEHLEELREGLED